MRTTLTIDDDVLDKAKAVAAKPVRPFGAWLMEALRTGLQMVEETQARLDPITPTPQDGAESRKEPRPTSRRSYLPD